MPGKPFVLSIFMHGQPADIDRRVADDPDKALVGSFPAGVDRNSLRNWLTRNQTLPHPVRVRQGLELYAYDVAIIPDAARRTAERINHWHLASCRTDDRMGTGWNAEPSGTRAEYIAHDGHVPLAAVYLLPHPLTMGVQYYDKGRSGPPRQDSKTYTLTNHDHYSES